MAVKRSVPQGVSVDMTDNFNFQLIGPLEGGLPFAGYVSAADPTAGVAPTVLIQGSRNVYKKSSGTIANRPGLKRRGSADTTQAGVKSSFEFDVLGNLRPLRVANSKLQVELDTTGNGNYVWVDLLTDLGDNMRFVFDSWWDDDAKKDVCVFVNGTGTLFSWSGGAGVVASATGSTITLNSTETLAELGFTSSGMLTIDGTDYAYDAAGISENTVYSQNPIDNLIAVSATDWTSQAFTTSANANHILRATVVFNNASMPVPGPVIVVAALYTDNAGSPGTKITSAQSGLASGANVGTGDASFTFTFNQAVSPNTMYHLVVSYITGNGALTIYTGTNSGVGTNISNDSGRTWSAQDGYLNATIIENTANEQTFVGVTPNPSAILAGTPVVQKVASHENVPAADFSADFLKTVNNQVHVGSYGSRAVYVSASSDYTNYFVPDVRAAGDPDLLTFDSQVRGISVQKGSNQTQSAAISGSRGDWYTVIRSNITVGTTLTEQVQIVRSDTADLETALAHEFIDTIGDSIVFLDSANQMRQYGIVRNIVTPVYPHLSLDIQDELSTVDFTGGHLRVASDDRGSTIIYVTAPLIGTDYMYQLRERLDTVGNKVAERLWHPPQIRNLSRIAIIDGIVYGYSNANPQTYQLWNTNQWHDDSPDNQPLPYSCIARFAYRGSGRREMQERFDKVYYEGYISGGSEVNGKVFFDYQGATDIAAFTINSADNPVPIFLSQNDASLGESSLGDNPLGDATGDAIDDQSRLPKFRVIRGVTEVDCFEHSLEVSSEQVDARWELIALGVNAQLAKEQPQDIVRPE